MRCSNLLQNDDCKILLGDAGVKDMGAITEIRDAYFQGIQDSPKEKSPLGTTYGGRACPYLYNKDLPPIKCPYFNVALQ